MTAQHTSIDTRSNISKTIIAQHTHYTNSVTQPRNTHVRNSRNQGCSTPLPTKPDHTYMANLSTNSTTHEHNPIATHNTAYVLL